MKEKLKSIHITKEGHKKIKIYCATNGLKINELVENVVISYINNNKLKK